MTEPTTPRKLASLVLLACALLPASAFAGTVVCPGPNTLEGIDISVWQGNIDWPAVKAGGKVYASIRVSDGTYLDTKFAQNWSAAKAAGVIRGVYQFFEPGVDPIVQADLLLSKTGPYQAGDMPPMIDVEATGNLPPATVAANVTKWVNHIKAATGRDPIVYTGYYFWKDNVQSSAQAANPLWHAQYCNCCPTIANPWTYWTFWQYTSTGSIPGIPGNVDHDKWNGTIADLQKFVGQQGCTPHCDGAVMVDADCNKGDCSVYGATCVNDDIGLRCISTFCPAKGDTTVCLPSDGNKMVGTCKNGSLTQGDCSAYGAWCSTKAGPAPKCSSMYCSASPQDPPQTKDVCTLTGERAHCDNQGNLTPKPCPSGQACNTFGGATVCGNPIVAMADLVDGTGYWALRVDGTVQPFGLAPALGSIAAAKLKSAVVGIAAAQSGKGYWVAQADGTVTAFGDAVVVGDMAGQTLPGPIVGIRRAGSSAGYWLAGTDGSVYGFGGAVVPGSMAGKALAGPIVGIESTVDGAGYWLAGADGGVFAYGSATYLGGAAGKTLASPIVGITRTLSGQGYWLYAQGGTLYDNGNAKVSGSPLGNAKAPIIGMAHHAFSSGYWLLDNDGNVYDYPGDCSAMCVGDKLTAPDCSVSDCAAMGGSCVTDAAGAHCASMWCPPVGTFFTCLPDPTNHVLAGTCQNGTLLPGSCKVGEQWCSDKGASGPGCVSNLCVPAFDATPVEHDFCLDNGTLGHCDGQGKMTPAPCLAGWTCQAGASAVCVQGAPGPDVTTEPDASEDASTEPTDIAGVSDADAGSSAQDAATAADDASTTPDGLPWLDSSANKGDAATLNMRGEGAAPSCSSSAAPLSGRGAWAVLMLLTGVGLLTRRRRA